MMLAKQRLFAFITILLVLFYLGCGNKQQTANQEAQKAQSAQQAQPSPAAQQSQSAQMAQSAQAGQSETSNRKSEEEARRVAEAQPPAPKAITYTIAAGTPIHIHLSQAISSGTATAGSSFDGTLSSPLTSHGVVVISAGSAVSGEITVADKGGRLHHPPALALRLTSITPRLGASIPISTSTWSERGKSKKKRDAVAIGGGAGVGAIIGALAGHGKGAAIGAAIGAGGGTAGAAFTGEKQIVLPAEAPVRFVLREPISITKAERE